MALGFRGFNRGASSTPKTLVTYYVDSGESYQEKVKKGESVLSPTSFTPAKTGYTFHGWREDDTASSTILATKTADGKTMSLYAVFKKSVTVSYIDASVNTSTSDYIYYNNANSVNPTFTLTVSALTNWTVRGWTTSASGGASAITYSSGVAFSVGSDITLYGVYQRTVTVAYAGNGSTSGSTANSTGTAYFHPVSGYTNASITLRSNGFTRTGYTYVNWRLNGTSGTEYNAGATYASTSDATMYASWSRNAYTVTVGTPYFTKAFVDEYGSTTPQPYNTGIVVDCTDYKYAKVDCDVYVGGQQNATSGYVYNTLTIRVGDANHVGTIGTVYEGGDYGGHANNWDTVRTRRTVTIDVSSLSGNKYIYSNESQTGAAGRISSGWLDVYQVVMTN